MSECSILRPALLAAILAAGLAACGEEAPSPEAEVEGREETRGIRNTQAIGYSGAAVADKVDAALDAAEEHERRMQEAEEAAQ